MNRRSFLTAVGSAALAGASGCAAAPASVPDVSITDIYPDGTEETYEGEYVVFRNREESEVSLTGYTVAYSSGHSHELSELALEPRASLRLWSRDGGSRRLESRPPQYLLFAGIGEESDTSVMDGTGNVELRDPSGNLVNRAWYGRE
ncbi:lamin tail domain-containing protein [Halosimplex pelagicum]|uniref:Lamin tail domain-containing protein n=1 Tax=Halosimplex pelagicum TaxID=869886 RepID=A0A7D5PGC6_9EURY|nr:lamin tail domain-containing protein [Halosimplex pelagicum]QLH84260.1 lamin tail domain-containing protein [Halosimplex pelagicum]